MKTIKVVLVSLIALGIFFGIAACAWAEQYPAVLIVVQVDKEENLLYLYDFNGFEWLYEEIEDWMEGDIAGAIMDDNNTPCDITDDAIIEMRYCGYIEGWQSPSFSFYYCNVN